MNRIVAVLCLFAAVPAFASWYWPFGGKAKDKPPRVAELMEPVSVILDEASDYADQDKIEEAVAAYQRALAQLDRIEAENADRAASAAFATLRNKRIYIDSAIDGLLLRQARQNARAVAVTDTTELERRYERLKRGEKLTESEQLRLAEKEVSALEDGKTVENALSASVPEDGLDALRKELAAKPGDRRLALRLAGEEMKAGAYGEALSIVEALLAERPNDAAALNMRAMLEERQGDVKKSAVTLKQCIRSNPSSHYAYYNMARLIMRLRGEEGRDDARLYYETGRKVGGPVDAALEGLK